MTRFSLFEFICRKAIISTIDKENSWEHLAINYIWEVKRNISWRNDGKPDMRNKESGIAIMLNKILGNIVELKRK